MQLLPTDLYVVQGGPDTSAKGSRCLRIWGSSAGNHNIQVKLIEL